jgi:hypothetical protein
MWWQDNIWWYIKRKATSFNLVLNLKLHWSNIWITDFLFGLTEQVANIYDLPYSFDIWMVLLFHNYVTERKSQMRTKRKDKQLICWSMPFGNVPISNGDTNGTAWAQRQSDTEIAPNHLCRSQRRIRVFLKKGEVWGGDVKCTERQMAKANWAAYTDCLRPPCWRARGTFSCNLQCDLPPYKDA